MGKVSKIEVKHISLVSVDPPPDVDRMEIDQADIDELAQSIRDITQLQAVLVRPVGDRYEIVFGHRRYLACAQLSCETIRAEIRPMTDREAAIARAVENLHRVDLTSIEEAKVYARLQDKHHMTLEEIAERMKKKPGTVKRRLDLLKMPPQLQTAVHRKEISVSVAEELWPISDPTALEYYLMFAVENGCTKNVARSWTKEWKDQSRRAEASGDGLPLPLSPQAPRPIFIACDLCHGPVELGKDRMLRICPDCYGEIKKAIGGPL